MQDKKEHLGRRNISTIVLIALVIVGFGAGISLFFSNMMNNFLYEQKIGPQIHHTITDASLDLSDDILYNWESNESIGVFNRLYIDAKSSAKIIRMEVYNDRLQLIWSSEAAELGKATREIVVFESLKGKPIYKSVEPLDEVAVKTGISDILVIYTPILGATSSHEDLHGHEETIGHSDENIEFSGEPGKGVIKMYLDASELAAIRKNFALYIWGLTFSSLIVISAVLHFIFKKQTSELLGKNYELIQYKRALENKNVQLEKANSKITAALNAKTDFINRAAHDLRTPLTPILTLLPIIQKNEKNKKIKHNLSVVQKNSKYLSNIVEELLELIRSEAKDYNCKNENLNLHELVEELLFSNEVNFKKSNIKIDLTIPKGTVVFADRQKIMEVFQNITSNAVKFMPNGGTLGIFAKKEGKNIEIKFKDTGIGMSLEILSKLFTEFYKADESRHNQGSGLGLSICKKILESCGGSISAQSEGLGKGSTIILNIPDGRHAK